MKKLIALSLALAPVSAFAVTYNNLDDIITYGLGYGNTFIQIIIALAVIYIVYGVFTYLIRGANSEDGKEKGKNTILYGVIGLFVILSIWGIVNIVRSTFKTGDNRAPTEAFPKVGDGVTIPR